MRPTQKLNEMIVTHMSKAGHVPEVDPEAEFVISALRAAIAANSIARRKILSEVSDMLACKSEDLDFLFSEFSLPASSSASYEVMVPDFQSKLYAIAE